MIVVATPMFSGSRILIVPFLIFIINNAMKVVDVCNRTKYGYSLVNITHTVGDIIVFLLEKRQTLRLYISQTA